MMMDSEKQDAMVCEPRHLTAGTNPELENIEEECQFKTNNEVIPTMRHLLSLESTESVTNHAISKFNKLGGGN